jgi:hypothetical protein
LVIADATETQEDVVGLVAIGTGDLDNAFHGGITIMKEEEMEEEMAEEMEEETEEEMEEETEEEMEEETEEETEEVMEEEMEEVNNLIK